MKGIRMDTRTYNGETFDDAVRVSSPRIYIKHKHWNRIQVTRLQEGYTNLHRLIPPGYVITKNTIKCSPIGNTIVGAREKGCTRQRQYAIDKIKKPTQPAFSFA